MLTLEEAIKHYEEEAEENEDLAKMYYKGPTKYIDYGNKYKALAEDQRQLAEWLKELKEHRRKGFKSYGYAEYDPDYPHR